jgi:hypothetical protein
MKRFIKPPENKKARQWLWFAALWFGGLSVVLVLSYLIRLAMGIE